MTRDTEFRRSIVKRILVVPVVPSLSNGAERNNGILTGVGEDIIGVVSVEMGRRVDKSGEVQHNAVTQSSSDKECVPELFPPEVRSNLCWHHIAHVKGEPWV